MIKPGEAIGLIKNYNKLIMILHERVTVYIAKQEEILKTFNDV